MSDQTDSTAIIRNLKDIEDIKKLKAKYFRCCDARLLNELEECFSDDAVADYALPEHLGERITLKGKAAIMDFFSQRKKSGQGEIIRVHLGHNPEISVTSDTTARGIWQLFLFRMDTQTNKGAICGGDYNDEYVKENGDWKIKSVRDTLSFKGALTLE